MELLHDQNCKVPDDLVEGILAVGTKGVLAGSSKSSKTWLLLDMGLSVATGTNWMGLRVKRGRVLFVNLEIGEAFLRKRLIALVDGLPPSHRDLSLLDFWHLRGHLLDIESFSEELRRRIQANHYALIVIDPIYKLMAGLDENRAGDVGALCCQLEALAKSTGAAVVYAAHFSKGAQAGKEAMDRISGSGVIGRDADSLITLTRHAVDKCFVVETTLRNHPGREPFVVEWAFPRMKPRDDLDPNLLRQGAGAKRSASPEQVYQLVPESQPIPSADLYELCRGRGISKNPVAQHIARLLDDGRIFRWMLPRPGKKPAVGYAKTPQPPKPTPSPAGDHQS